MLKVEEAKFIKQMGKENGKAEAQRLYKVGNVVSFLWLFLKITVLANVWNFNVKWKMPHLMVAVLHLSSTVKNL